MLERILMSFITQFSRCKDTGNKNSSNLEYCVIWGRRIQTTSVSFRNKIRQTSGKSKIFIQWGLLIFKWIMSWRTCSQFFFFFWWWVRGLVQLIFTLASYVVVLKSKEYTDARCVNGWFRGWSIHSHTCFCKWQWRIKSSTPLRDF